MLFLIYFTDHPNGNNNAENYETSTQADLTNNLNTHISSNKDKSNNINNNAKKRRPAESTRYISKPEW
jgi:hypothetical protein